MTANLPRQGHPLKLTGWAGSTSIREAIKRPKITMEGLQRSIAHVGESVHKTTFGLLTVSYKKNPFGVCHKLCGRQSKRERRCSGQMVIQQKPNTAHHSQ